MLWRWLMELGAFTPDGRGCHHRLAKLDHTAVVADTGSCTLLLARSDGGGGS